MGKESVHCTYPMQIVLHLCQATVSQSCLQLFLPLDYGIHLQSIDVTVSSRGQVPDLSSEERAWLLFQQVCPGTDPLCWQTSAKPLLFGMIGFGAVHP
jgi:hypothetical protein